MRPWEVEYSKAVNSTPCCPIRLPMVSKTVGFIVAGTPITAFFFRLQRTAINTASAAALAPS